MQNYKGKNIIMEKVRGVFVKYGALGFSRICIIVFL
jgi:hypothetical protein